MSVQAIRDGLYLLLTTCGPWAASEVSACTFDILTHGNGGCALVFLPDGTSPIEPLAIGGTNQRAYLRRWRIGGAVYIRDFSAEKPLWGKVWQAYDDLYGTVRKDDTLNGAAEAAYLVSVSHRPGFFLKAGGHVWKPVEFAVIAEEFD